MFWDGGTYRVRFASTSRRVSGGGASTRIGRCQTASRPAARWSLARQSKIIRIVRWPAALSGTCIRPQLLLRRRVAGVLGHRYSLGAALARHRGDVAVYAADRQAKGFNAVLLMSVQPDMNARGPARPQRRRGLRDRLPRSAEGRLTKINLGYFQYFDRLIDILIKHGIAPVLQPVFPRLRLERARRRRPGGPPADYARYCRYLVARYGARPAIYLPCADGAARAAGRGRRSRDRSLGRVRSSHWHPLPAAPPQRRAPGRRLAGLPVVPDRPQRVTTCRDRGDYVGAAAGQGDHERRAEL